MKKTVIKLLLGLSALALLPGLLTGCGGKEITSNHSNQQTVPSSLEQTVPTTQPPQEEMPLVMEYEGLRLHLPQNFRSGQVDEYERMHYQSDELEVAVSHCHVPQWDLGDNASEIYADNLRYRLEDGWETVTTCQLDEKIFYTLCANTDGACYASAQVTDGDVCWYLDFWWEKEQDSLSQVVAILKSCHRASAIRQTRELSLGLLSLTTDRDFSLMWETAYSCRYELAPYTVEMYAHPCTSVVEAEEAAQQWAQQEKTRVMGQWQHTLDWSGEDYYTYTGWDYYAAEAVGVYYRQNIWWYIRITADEEFNQEAMSQWIVSGSWDTDYRELPELTVSCEQTWEAMSYLEERGLAEKWGRYRIVITGLATPVTLDMEGLDTLCVQAYGNLVHEIIPCEEGMIGVSVSDWQDTILVNGGSGYLITPTGSYRLGGDDGTDMWLSTDDAGNLRYTRSAGLQEFQDQWDTAVIDTVTSRDAFYEETGTITLKDGQVVCNQETLQTVSDVFDLDAMFADAKEAGFYPEYDTLDDLLEANKHK